ncbi:MAG: ABC-type transport system, permease component [Nitrospira sp.]|nr:MAG: ABC-type transport system, permease component [Nitrospira sp.]
MVLWLYTLRNLWSRRITAALTVMGLGLVVFVFLAVLMLAHGLERTMGNTGDPSNAIILRKGARTELDSHISRDHARVIATQQEIMLSPDRRPLGVSEVGFQVTLRKDVSGGYTNFALRGSALEALAVRPQVRLTQGRAWEPGTTEIMVGAQVAKQFPSAGLNQTIRFGNRDWTIVGIFEADGSGFESEVWGDAEQFMATFRRTTFSSMTVRLARPGMLDEFKGRMERDPRFSLTVKREPEYYEEKAGTLSRMIRVTGLFLTAVFSVGAILGATMTMSTAVAQRTTEIGTLRTLGFTRADILLAFLVESTGFGIVAGILGLAGASFLQSVTISTMNWDTSSELVFSFQLSSGMIGQGVLFAVLMSIVGGLVPAIQASRLEVVQALGERTA